MARGHGKDEDDGGTDWLLAQLVTGRAAEPEQPQGPPVTPTPAPAEPDATGAEPAVAAPVDLPLRPPAPRREEVLDWFTLADAPASSTDAATRALPVIGEPQPDSPAADADAGAGAAAAAASAPVEPQPAPGLPTWSPPFVASPPPPSAHAGSVEPPVGETPRYPIAPPPGESMPSPAQQEFPVQPPASPASPPGPVTPTGPFALTWGTTESETEESIRDAFRRLSEPSGGQVPPADAPSTPRASGSATPGPQPSDPAPQASAPGDSDDPFAGFTPPPVARSSFTPVGTEPIRHPTAPESAPSGWDERPAAGDARPAAYDTELWAALNEAEPTGGRPAQPEPAQPEPAQPEPAQPEPAQPEPAQPEPAQPEQSWPRTPEPAPTRPDPLHPGVALSQPLGQPPASPAPSPAASNPFPAFASDPGPQAEPARPAPVDDLLAQLGNRWAAREAAAAAAAAATAGAANANDAAFDDTVADAPTGPLSLAAFGLAFDADREPEPDAADDGPDADGTGAHSPIARQVAEAGYFWNLTPDPSAADPNADLSGAAATINRLGATPAAEPEPEPAWEPDPAAEQTWEPETAGQPEPAWGSEPAVDEAWEPEPVWEPAPLAQDPETEAFAAFGPNSFDDGASDDRNPTEDDPLAALFGAAAVTAPRNEQPTAPRLTDPFAAVPTQRESVNDPFAHLAPAGPVASGVAASAAPAASAAGAPAAYSSSAGSAPRSRGDGAGSGSSGRSSGSGGAGDGHPKRTTRTLIWIAGGLAALLVLTGLFFLGTQFGRGAVAPAAAPSPSATETPVPAPTAAQPVGVHAWDTLFGGECINPFTDPWAEEFAVVDCAAPHAAQLVLRGALAGDAAAPFPGEAELAAQMNALCTATGVINLAAVAGMEDLQVQASYPVTEEQWADGQRTYYCFANRAGGEPLTASIAGPGPAA